MPQHFTTKTFKYFDAAAKNKDNKAWFDDNKELYQEHVREPFMYLVSLIGEKLQKDLPKIKIRPQSVTRPLRPKNRAAENGWVKDFSSIDLAQKRTSLFEWNPGIHLQIGSQKDDNFFGLGLYMVSGRQRDELREALCEDYSEIHKIMTRKKFKEIWGEILGEKYKRFPKGYDPESKAAKYLIHKQFYVGQTINRTIVKDKDFAHKVVNDLKVAIPFLAWIRKAVGVYRRGMD